MAMNCTPRRRRYRTIGAVNVEILIRSGALSALLRIMDSDRVTDKSGGQRIASQPKPRPKLVKFITFAVAVERDSLVCPFCCSDSVLFCSTLLSQSVARKNGQGKKTTVRSFVSPDDCH